MNRSDFQVLATVRLADAKALLAAERFSAAYYLAGYAVECALKACVAKRTQQYDFPDKAEALRAWTHDYEILVESAKVGSDFRRDIAECLQLGKHWGTLQQWSEDARYNSDVSAEKAAELIKAIEDRPHGILAWIEPRW